MTDIKGVIKPTVVKGIVKPVTVKGITTPTVIKGVTSPVIVKAVKKVIEVRKAILCKQGPAGAGGGVSLNDLRQTATFVDGDLVGGILTITHTLTEQYLHTTIFDENGLIIGPDDIDCSTGADTVLVDLNSFIPLISTWRYRVSL